jgi:manganese transport protein
MLVALQDFIYKANMRTHKLFRPLIAIVGPATIMTAGAMGTGSTASLILSGAWFRYDLLWVLLATLPLYIIVMDSASRVGVVYGNRGMMTVIRENISVQIAWLIFVVHVPLHFLLVMGNMSVMTSSFLSLIGVYPPAIATEVTTQTYQAYEIGLSLLFAVSITWLMVSGGYDAIRNVLAALVFILFLCFCIVAFSGFSEWRVILSGFIPQIPESLVVPGSDKVRSSSSSIIAIAGGVIAPSAMLGISYMSADNNIRTKDFGRELKNSIINYGLIFGGYSIFVLIAGGYALYGLPNHAEIELIHEAGRVLTNVFPEKYSFLGAKIFSIGLFLCALTTLVVVVQISAYFFLDILGKNWRYTTADKNYSALIALWVLLPSVVAPLWQFPALLKILLLIGINLVIAPGVILMIIFLANNGKIMKAHKAGPVRNGLLFIAFSSSLLMGIFKIS